MHDRVINSSSEHILKHAGLQKTSQRLAVLEIMNETERPLTATDVLKRMPEGQKVNRVTIYRILASYTVKGIIREFALKRGIHYYERVMPGIPPHPHFYCRGCGALICLTAETESWTWLANQSDLEIESISISGLCRLCKANKERKKDEKEN
ncbi:MAG: transcriptional repressor [Syntrophaceae bacterium]|nr:transcriptional repressor [Syntrophaceae bacterium]